MSKRIIAGLGVVAGLAVALAPIASFATGQNTDRTVVDNLEVTIESSCAFGHDFTDGNIDDLDGVVRTDGTADWETTTSGEASTFANGSSEDTAAATMEAGTATASFATTELTVFCNNGSGYTISALGTNLVSDDSDGATAHPIVAAAGASSVTGAWSSSNTSKWSWKPTLTATSNAAMASGYTTADTEYAAPTGSAATIVSGTSSTENNGDVLNIVYSVGLVNNQDAGTYEGSMTYTLAEVQGS
ncbi:hypothetical protein IJH66_01240 [Candidatus Saccharibacteria bacterium]|nr:hypothetical protein [Candidatus Saccharibacteria bacterium]